jgi:hypothetical protein
MRPCVLLFALTPSAFAQDFVRPWVVPPPKASAPTVQFRAPDVPPPTRPVPQLLPAGFPFPIVLTPCTSFPGNPVFVIEGDKITMRKAPDR